MRAINNIGQPIRPMPKHRTPQYDAGLARGILVALFSFAAAFGVMWLARGK